MSIRGPQAAKPLSDLHPSRYASETRRDWDTIEACRNKTKAPVIAFGLVRRLAICYSRDALTFSRCRSAPFFPSPRSRSSSSCGGLSRTSRHLTPTTPSSTTKSRQAGTSRPPNSRRTLPPPSQTRRESRRFSATVASRAVRRWSGTSWASLAEDGVSSIRAG